MITGKTRTIGLTHEERRERRKQIAEECRTKPMAEVATSYGLTISTIAKICSEHKITPPRNLTVAMPSTFLILKHLIDGEKPAELARKFNVTRQCVDQVKQRGIAAGFAIATRKENKR